MPRRPSSQGKVNLLKKVCAFHARLQREQKAINVEARSLHRLGDALSTILHSKIEMLNLSKAVDQYLLHGNDAARPIIVRECSQK